MPTLHSPIHVRTLDRFRRAGSPGSSGLYGLQWGDPDKVESLKAIRNHWLLPYVDPDQVALEIGPGGGRWTRYMLPFMRIYAVDLYADMLAELRKNFAQPNIVEVRNSGTDFPNVPLASIDFLFSFGCFVHLDAPIIAAYLANMRAIIHLDTQVVIQYSDKTKPLAANNPRFADNDPVRMRTMVERAGYRILQEDTTSLRNSAIMRFVLA